MKKTILVAFVALAAFIFQSCGDGANVMTEAQASFEMKAVSGTAAPAGGRAAATGLFFTEVYAGVTEIELETLEEQSEEEENGGESEDEEIEFEGNFIINLLTGTSDPDFGMSELLAGVYQEVEIEFDNILDGGNTLVANFYFVADGTTDTTFVEFSTEEEFEIEIENEAGYVFDGGIVNSILVTLDLDVLFGAIDFSALAVDGDGVIRISEDSNQSVMENIVESLEDALEAEEEDEEDDDEDEEEEDGDDE